MHLQSASVTNDNLSSDEKSSSHTSPSFANVEEVLPKETHGQIADRFGNIMDDPLISRITKVS